MLKPIIISFKLTTCQLLYLTSTYKPREILLTIKIELYEKWQGGDIYILICPKSFFLTFSFRLVFNDAKSLITKI